MGQHKSRHLDGTMIVFDCCYACVECNLIRNAHVQAMTVPESEVMLVHLDHPVLQMLERRPEIFGVSTSIFSASSTPNW